MSGFFWNIRGLNKSNKQSVVKEWVRRNNLEFGCLLETKVKVNKAARIVEKIFPTWNMTSNYEYNRRGRVWVVWSEKVKVQVIYKSGQMITCLVQLGRDLSDFLCSFIYASNFVDDRKDLWRDIMFQHGSSSTSGIPWLLMGDFNETLLLEDHSSSDTHSFVTAGMRDFREVINSCTLSELPNHGPPFTWSNKREEGLICKKLDRILSNYSWVNHYQESYYVMDSGGCSDHLRGSFFLKGDIQKKKAPFKFANAILSQPEFYKQLEDFWSSTRVLFHSTSALHRLTKKLKGLKPLIRALSREKLAELSRKTKEAYEILCASQLTSITNLQSYDVAAEAAAFARWEKVANLEEAFLKQKSKLHWLKVGDRNNRYFHSSMKERHARNRICEIINPMGVRLIEEEDIKEEAVNFFKNLLTNQPAVFTGYPVNLLQDLMEFRCDDHQCALLLTEVTADEIKKVIFSMPLNKSPGPDGYTVEFFKAAWSIIGEDIVKAVQSFFIYGFLPKGLNSTILALIPKKTSAQEMKDYRPISCCNVLYKTISKVIANRLKVILPDLIAPNQSAFIKDRLMMENLLLATELVKDYHKEGISTRCAVKIDISKAFDSVQWEFLLNVLHALNFPDRFIHWIRLCVTTPSFSVQVNGEIAGFFQSTRGLRQGCSLSPYLFVICMNVLSKLLDRASTEGKIGYHPRCKNLQLSHLCFADDIMVFSDGSPNSLDGILEVFEEFAMYSGLQISPEKSTIYLAGVTAATRREFLSRFQFEFGTLPVRYLGLPLLTKEMKLHDCLPLLEQIKSKIDSWRSRFLSFAGRLQLLGSVISSLTNFWISAFRLPSACIKEIEKICAAFLWSGPDLNTKKAKVTWSDVCKPKLEGGLGLKSILEANKVSCYKLIWRLFSSTTSLWVSWIQRELIRSASFWSLKVTAKGSWMWRKLLKYRPNAQPFLRQKVNSGTTTSFWFDSWCPLGRLHDITGDRGFIDLGIQKAATVAEAVRSRSRRLHRLTLPNLIEDELDFLRTRGLNSEPDYALWRNSEGIFKACFSTKDTWQQIRKLGHSRDEYRGIWFTGSTPKYSFLQWLTTLNRLPTGDRMLTWQAQINPSCTFCAHSLETRDHLFFSCNFTSKIWKSLALGLLNQHYTESFNHLLTLASGSTFSATQRFLIRYALQASIHTLWLERNRRRHGELPRPTRQLIDFVDHVVRNRISSLVSRLPAIIEAQGRSLPVVWKQTALAYLFLTLNSV